MVDNSNGIYYDAKEEKVGISSPPSNVSLRSVDFI